MTCSIAVISFIDMPCWLNHIFFWIHDHQALVIGLVAAILSALMIWQIRGQIKQQDEIEDRRRARKLRALKAKLPVALTEINEYAEDNLLALLQSLARWNHEQCGDWGEPKKLGPEQFELSDFPAEALAVVTEAIEAAEECDAVVLSHLASFSQVNRSRLKGLRNALSGEVPEDTRVLFENDFFRSIRDTLELIAHVNRCYGYARGMRNHIEPFPEQHGFARYDGPMLNSDLHGPLMEFLDEHWLPDWGTLIAERSLRTLKD